PRSRSPVSRITTCSPFPQASDRPPSRSPGRRSKFERKNTGCGRSRSSGVRETLLVLEQPALHVVSERESGEGAVRSDHPVTRHDQADRVASIRPPHRPRGAPQLPRNRAIAPRIAIRDTPERVPDSQLVGRPFRRQLELERLPHAGEILLNLLPRPPPKPSVT